ncbi:unnamed protein product [Diplocarpon coronariae]
MGGIPSRALGASVAVLLYSSGCLALSTLLTCLLVNFGEAWSYVTIISGFTSLSTFASIVEQIHYAVAWVTIKEAQYEKAVESQYRQGLQFRRAALQLDSVLFFIQFYSYNVMSLSVLFWTVALFTGSWGIRSNWLGDWHSRASPVSKVFSILFPGLIIGLMQIESLQREALPFIVMTYFSMFTSLSIGSILLILILYKYMKTRRLVAGHSHQRGRWWASEKSNSRSGIDSHATGPADSGVTGVNSIVRKSIYDRALIIRFTIGFVVISIFELAIIVFTLFQSGNNAAIAYSGKPDFSISNAIHDIVFFIPGVTASLAAFLVFGTTKSWRQYRDLVTGGCGLRARMLYKRRQRNEEVTTHQGLGLQRLPSLTRKASEEQLKVVQEYEDRVRMFSQRLCQHSIVESTRSQH